MATIKLHPDTAGVTLSEKSRRLYNAYRKAKAEWDVILYAPERHDSDVPDEINDPLSDAHTAALNAFLLAPVDTIAALSRKLTVFAAEEIHDGWYMAHQIVGTLDMDGRRVWDASRG
ncbi:MAG: hypothetical protein Q8R44_09195 [Novosphingobium sp.]|nr:hypothetical protein [Novosphingobium sp.]